MSSEQATTKLWIADVDVHLNEDPTRLAAYCAPPWRESLHELQHVTERYLDIPGFSVGWEGLDPPSPGRTVTGVNAGLHPDWEGRTVRSARQMRTELTGLGVDAAIIFPDHLLTLAALPNPAYACALAEAYNRWLVAEWLSDQSGLYGAIIAAPHDPVAAAAEIRRCAHDKHVVAVYLPTAAVSPLWGHRRYDPIYVAAQEVGLPVVLHSVAIIHPAFPHQVHDVEPAGARHALVHAFGMMANLVSIVGTGVPVRFPNLRVVFTEAGLGWLPYISSRLDKEYLERRREFAFYSERPSHYIRDFYLATQPIEEPDNSGLLTQLIEGFGMTEQIMFASDWPHHDFDHPRQVLGLKLAGNALESVMGGTAQRVFGLTAEAAV